MSNYTKITDFAAKDALAPGNPAKIITGTAHDNEYNAIAVAIATKADATGAALVSPVTLDAVTITATANEINILDGVTASATEINVLDGIPATLTATELGYVDGVTSAIQTQLDAKYATSKITISTSAASGGSDKDIWFQY